VLRSGYRLSILFLGFFNITKHHPVLRPINVFNDDPYDAVSSFGVQVALLAALMAFFWIFVNDRRRELQAEMMAILAVMVSLIADAVAMVRYVSLWVGKPGGNVLAVLLVAMLLLAGMVSMVVLNLKGIDLKIRPRSSTALVSLAIILLLAVYPAHLDDGMIGGIGTALLGMVLLFVAVWLWMRQLFPMQPIRLKGRFVLPVVIFGMVAGLGLAILEGLGEGIPRQIGMLLVVMSVFIGIEGSGVVLGYLLLSDYLGLP
jgi:hypothetical protein